MILVVIFVLFVVIVCWRCISTRANGNTRRRVRPRKGTVPKEVDYVVVGAGPGGLAASQHLLQENDFRSVLLVEKGSDFSTGFVGSFIDFYRSDRLLSHTVDLADSPFNQCHPVPAPFCNTTSCDGDVEGDDKRGSPIVSPSASKASCTYRRGCGVGGTSLIDWCLYFPSVFNGSRSSGLLDGTGFGSTMHRFALGRNPLSWAFAESCATVMKQLGILAVGGSEVFDPIQPALLRVDAHGRRVSLSHHMMKGKRSQLTVVTGSTLTGMIMGKGGVVRGVLCESEDSSSLTIAVRRGVILAAGVFGTPRILREVFPKLQERYLCRDTVAIPLIFQAYPGLSDDRLNVRTVASYAAWLFGGRGPLCHPFCDTVVGFALPALDPLIELVAFLIPVGGRDADTFRRLGFDRLLGAFSEGFTILVTVRGVDGVYFDTVADGMDLKHHDEGGFLAPNLTDTHDKIIKALAEGIRLCRKIVEEEPLRHLSCGAEAIDPTLLGDKGRAGQYVRLLHTPRRKLTREQRASASTVFSWAKEVASQQEYMESYVRRHAMWLGFGNGACAKVVSENGSVRVSGTKNVFIGDCTAVSDTLWRSCGYDSLCAGSVTTAMAFGKMAAAELLRA